MLPIVLVPVLMLSSHEANGAQARRFFHASQACCTDSGEHVKYVAWEVAVLPANQQTLPSSSVHAVMKMIRAERDFVQIGKVAAAASFFRDRKLEFTPIYSKIKRE